MMKLKVCGMRDSQNIQDLLVLKPDFMGFIFYEQSPRNAIEILDEQLLKSFPTATKKVGVFVNEEITKVEETVLKYDLDLVQLHGDESVEYVSKMKDTTVSLIKAFAIHQDFDFNQLSAYAPFVDYFLFDTKGEERGGTGKKFDWELLKNYTQNIPFFLSGGIEIEDIEDIKSLSELNVVSIDVNSKFEVKPGLKNIERLKRLKELL